MENNNIFNEEADVLSGFVGEDWGGEESDYNSQRQSIEVAQLQEELDGKKQDRIQRKEYASKIYILLCCYLGAVLVLLYLTGFKMTELDEAVLIALITTTTTNVIGIFYFVAKYLFHTKE